MICHPVILGSKLVVLIVVIVVLVILHSYLTPNQFRVAVIIGAAIFLCFSFVLWIAFFKLLNNPESKMAKQMVLSQQARTENGFQASSDEFASLVGNRGVAFSPLRPAGIAVVEGKRIPVITEGGFIPSGSPVEIVAARGSRVVVRAVTESADTKEGQD